MNRLLPAAMAMILFAFAACQNQAAKSPAPVPAPPANASPSRPFTLAVSSGGGFTGEYQGCTLTSRGEVKAWRKRPGAPESIDWTVQGRPDSVLAFARELEPFLAIDLEETGNMTTRIHYVLPDTVHQWSISGSGASTGAPEPLRTWHARVEAYCRGLAPQP